MSSITQKLYNRNSIIFVELTLILFLFLLFTLFDYFICWQPTLNQFLHENHILQQKHTALLQKQKALIQEKNTLNELLQWRKSNAVFYATVSAVSNIDQQLSLLTGLIQNAHFTILKMDKPHISKHSQTDYTLSFTMTGQFIDLFSLITTLNHFAIPFTLSELSINHHLFKMTFVLRGYHA